MNNPFISFVIPTYNEEKDIESCINHVLDNPYSNKEIIVVDSASSDNTPEILERFAKKKLIYFIQEDTRNGVSSARNLGASKTRGDILVILNADVLLEPDYCDRIIKHYQKEADFVLCDSVVVNTDQVFGAFVQSLHDRDYEGKTDLVWTEGFSCRRRVFESVGGFKRFPRESAGEDAALGFDLDKKYKRVFDSSIKARHIVTTDSKEFAKLRIERGKGAFFFDVLYNIQNPTHIIIKRLRKYIFFFLTTLLLIIFNFYLFLIIFTLLFLIWFKQSINKSLIMSKKYKFFWPFLYLNLKESYWSLKGYLLGANYYFRNRRLFIENKSK